MNINIAPTVAVSIEKINDIITTDVGGRGMRHLVVDGDLLAAAQVLARLQPKQPSSSSSSSPIKPHVIVFKAAASAEDRVLHTIDLVFVNEGDNYSTSDKECINHLARIADLVIACERAGPASDGNCYTMRAINMTESGFIAPLHTIVDITREAGVKFIAIGDGGNELGMGKVLDKIRKEIPNGKKIGSVVRADYLIAASVSNWGAWALVAATALIRYNDRNDGNDDEHGREACIHRLCTTEEAEIALLNRVVEKGCRDGVTGLLDVTVDGMDIETNMMYFREIRNAALNYA